MYCVCVLIKTSVFYKHQALRNGRIYLNDQFALIKTDGSFEFSDIKDGQYLLQPHVPGMKYTVLKRKKFNNILYCSK